MRTFNATAIVTMILAGCTTGDKVSKLDRGMTPQQATDVLGSPDGQVTQGNLVGFTYVDRWISGWSNRTAGYLLVFDRGRLASWGTTTIRQPDHALAAMAFQYDRYHVIHSLGN